MLINIADRVTVRGFPLGRLLLFFSWFLIYGATTPFISPAVRIDIENNMVLALAVANFIAYRRIVLVFLSGERIAAVDGDATEFHPSAGALWLGLAILLVASATIVNVAFSAYSRALPGPYDLRNSEVIALVRYLYVCSFGCFWLAPAAHPDTGVPWPRWVLLFSLLGGTAVFTFAITVFG